MEEKQYISSVKMPDGSIYHIKDSEAQNILSLLFSEEIIIDGGNASADANECLIIMEGGNASY